MENIALPHPSLTPRASKDMTAYHVAPENLLTAMKALKLDYPMLMDITAIDHGVGAKQRFEVLYHIFNPLSHKYARVGVFCFNNVAPSVASIVSLYPAADWHEREAYDLMGVAFEGHPNLKRILMWDEYPYHPLRKDFPLAGLETPLHDEGVTEATQEKVKPAPMAGGPFVAKNGQAMAKAEPRAKDEEWNEGKLKKGNV